MAYKEIMSAVRNIESSYKSLREMEGFHAIVTYSDNFRDGWQILYNPEKDVCIHIEVIDGEVEETQVVPIAVVMYDDEDEDDIDEDELLNHRSADFTGEADDFSCYLYFDCV